jgi:hypothetical protein
MKMGNNVDALLLLSEYKRRMLKAKFIAVTGGMLEPTSSTTYVTQPRVSARPSAVASVMSSAIDHLRHSLPGGTSQRETIFTRRVRKSISHPPLSALPGWLLGKESDKCDEFRSLNSFEHGKGSSGSLSASDSEMY